MQSVASVRNVCERQMHSAEFLKRVSSACYSVEIGMITYVPMHPTASAATSAQFVAHWIESDCARTESAARAATPRRENKPRLQAICSKKNLEPTNKSKSDASRMKKDLGTQRLRRSDRA